MIPVLVSIATSFYVNTHLLKPRLRADWSWVAIFTIPVEKHPDQFIAAVVDFNHPKSHPTVGVQEYSCGGTKLIDYNGGEIVWAKRLTFKSKNDYTAEVSPGVFSPVMKVMVVNEGYATANNVRFGVNTMFGDPESNDVVTSPNVRVTREPSTRGGANESPLLKLEIDKLRPSERAVVTITSRQPSPAAARQGTVPFVKLRKAWVDGLAYINSSEGTGIVSPVGMSWRDMEAWEQFISPSAVIGFWPGQIHPKKGVSPEVEDVENFEIRHEVSDSCGHKLEGAWKLGPS